jgi:predicted DNA-binding WGR domain protein
MMRRFEFSMGGSDKFWEVELSGTELTVRFGRMGTNGQTQTKSFPSEAAAQKECDKLIAEKLHKGYVEVTTGGADAGDEAADLEPESGAAASLGIGKRPAGGSPGSAKARAAAAWGMTGAAGSGAGAPGSGAGAPGSGAGAGPLGSASKGSRSADAVKKVLEQAGVDTSTFERVSLEEDEEEDEGGKRHSDSDGSFYMVQVPKGKAMDIWRVVRNAVDSTGYWPVFTEEYDRLFEYMEFNEMEPAAILKSANSLDAKDWFETHVQEDPEMFEEALASSASASGAGWHPNSREDNLKAADDFYIVKSIGDFTSTMILVPTKTPWHVAAVLRWGGSNDGIEPEEHTALHKYWYTTYGAEPVVATMDIWEFRVAKPPQTREAAMHLAREQYIYCPDIVDQGCATIAGLASELIYSPRWYFWWD